MQKIVFRKFPKLAGNWIFTIFGLFGGISAQNVEYDIIRTPEVPGFFAIRIFPEKGMKPLEIENVFVKNFKNDAEKKVFFPVIETLKSTQSKVIEKTEIVNFLNISDYRIVLLGGEPFPQFLQFFAESDDILKDFEVFEKRYLGNVYLQNISAEFSENVSEVFPKFIPFLTEKTTFFIGKFEKAENVSLRLTAETKEETLEADISVDLTSYFPRKSSLVLPLVWENFSQPKSSENLKYSHFWINFFPVLLIIIGIGLLALAILSARSPAKKVFDLLDKNFWNLPLEETPLFQKWEQGFHWEIESKDGG